VQDQAVMGMKCGRLWPGRQRLADQSERLAGPALVQTQHRQEIISVGLLWNRRQNRPIQSLGFGLIASLLGRQALMQQPLQPGTPRG